MNVCLDSIFKLLNRSSLQIASNWRRTQRICGRYANRKWIKLNIIAQHTSGWRWLGDRECEISNWLAIHCVRTLIHQFIRQTRNYGKRLCVFCIACQSHAIINRCGKTRWWLITAGWLEHHRQFEILINEDEQIKRRDTIHAIQYTKYLSFVASQHREWLLFDR